MEAALKAQQDRNVQRENDARIMAELLEQAKEITKNS